MWPLSLKYVPSPRQLLRDQQAGSVHVQERLHRGVMGGAARDSERLHHATRHLGIVWLWNFPFHNTFGPRWPMGNPNLGNWNQG